MTEKIQQIHTYKEHLLTSLATLCNSMPCTNVLSIHYPSETHHQWCSNIKLLIMYKECESEASTLLGGSLRA